MMLKLLYQLQEIEAAIDRVEQAKRESDEYKSLRIIRNGFETKKHQYLRLENDLKQLAEQLAAFPQRIEAIGRKLAEEQAAIYNGSVLSTKVLAARETQAAVLAEKQAELKALQALYEGELAQKQAAYGQLKEEMEQQYAQFRQVKENYTVKEGERQARLEELTAQREALLAQIDAQSLAWYEAEKPRFGGTPVARLSSGHVCCGCHTVVTPIAFKRSQLKQKIHCERCGRSLFIDEE